MYKLTELVLYCNNPAGQLDSLVRDVVLAGVGPLGDQLVLYQGATKHYFNTIS